MSESLLLFLASLINMIVGNPVLSVIFFGLFCLAVVSECDRHQP